MLRKQRPTEFRQGNFVPEENEARVAGRRRVETHGSRGRTKSRGNDFQNSIVHRRKARKEFYDIRKVFENDFRNQIGRQIDARVREETENSLEQSAKPNRRVRVLSIKSARWVFKLDEWRGASRGDEADDSIQKVPVG